MKITIKDIAREASISESAVSLALNNKPGVSEQTRQIVLDIARKMGYKRTSAISDTKPAGQKLIRFLVCSNNDMISSNYYEWPFFMSLIQNIEKACSKRGYALLITSTEIRDLEESIRSSEENQPSVGLILLGTNVTAADVLIVQKYQPVLVVLDNVFEQLNVNCVGSNHYMAGFQAASYIVKKNFKKIGYVQSIKRPNNLEQVKKGFFEIMGLNAITIPEEYIFGITNSTEEGYVDFKNLLLNCNGNLPDVLFCEDDYMAIGAMRALQDAGIRVPEEVSIIGIDNISLSSTTTPPLTTIQIDTNAMSKAGVHMIIDIINNHEQPTMKVIVDTYLIERESCR